MHWFPDLSKMKELQGLPSTVVSEQRTAQVIWVTPWTTFLVAASHTSRDTLALLRLATFITQEQEVVRRRSRGKDFILCPTLALNRSTQGTVIRSYISYLVNTMEVNVP